VPPVTACLAEPSRRLRVRRNFAVKPGENGAMAVLLSIVAFVALLLVPATAAAQSHPFSIFKGRYAGDARPSEGYLWRSERTLRMAVEVVARADESVVIRWLVDRRSYAADVTGRIRDYAFRQAGDSDDLDWQCRIVDFRSVAQPLQFDVRLSCRPAIHDGDTAVTVLDLSATLDPQTARPTNECRVSISEFQPGAREATRRLTGLLTRVDD
jgi:hypothetical protein